MKFYFLRSPSFFIASAFAHLLLVFIIVLLSPQLPAKNRSVANEVTVTLRQAQKESLQTKSTSLKPPQFPRSRAVQRRVVQFSSPVLSGEAQADEQHANGGQASTLGPEQQASKVSVLDSDVLNKTVTPCHSIMLPPQWTQLRDVWPRKYNVLFQIKKDEDGSHFFHLKEMKSVATPYPALDLRVLDSFAECLQRQSSREPILQQTGFLALNNDAGDAYSVIIEFVPGNTKVAAQQGM